MQPELPVGCLLDELKNDFTRETPANFEPGIDYVVTQIPHFAFEVLAHGHHSAGRPHAHHPDEKRRRSDGHRAHARLDVSRRDDQCRLKNRNAVWVHGIFARLANSLFMEWRSHQPKPAHKSTTDFAAFMAADHARRLLFVVTSRHPSLKPPS